MMRKTTEAAPLPVRIALCTKLSDSAYLYISSKESFISFAFSKSSSFDNEDRRGTGRPAFKFVNLMLKLFSTAVKFVVLEATRSSTSGHLNRLVTKEFVILLSIYPVARSLSF